MPRTEAEEEEQREAAELLHALGTADALQRLGTRPGHAFARALLRDTRWDTPAAGLVPFVGMPGTLVSSIRLIQLRLRRAARIAATRWVSAASTSGLAGAIGGCLGGLLVAVAPGSHAPVTLAVVLALIGGGCGFVGGAGVGAGLAAAETVARSWRRVALVTGGALGGGMAGILTQWLGHVTLSNLVGVTLPIGGGLDGVVLGSAAGLSYAVGTSTVSGMATPRGRQRLMTVLLLASACGAAAFVLTVPAGRPLVGGTIHMIASATRGAQAVLTPLGHLIGEPDFGPLSQAIIGTLEGVLFGGGLAIGLTRRP